ncbi:LppP/LprE family lipoprotein [Corynebacterium cystitidis]|uniref:LppP/LprE family lipoprotein n=1 Tax=Corynebacterium cystitidis TaxID=35757 RepID=UPI00211E3AE9|nr:LppP/LprE family lipoprotein [Corynebacterium cystitidis]
MKIRRVLIALTVSGAVLLAGCNATTGSPVLENLAEENPAKDDLVSEDPSGQEAPNVEAPSSAAPSSLVSLPPTQTTDKAHPPVRATTPTEACDPSAANPLASISSLPIIDSGGHQFTFSITQDAFDPCAPLSWSVIAGGVGPGNSLRQGVVFFHQGRPISQPAPLMQEQVTAVTPHEDGSVEVSYQVLDGPRAAANTLPSSARFALNGEGTLEIVDNTLPLVANEAGIQLDVSGL